MKIIVFHLSKYSDKELGSIALPVKEGRQYLSTKTEEAFKYIYKHHMNDADWFLKADDDTYVIVENLRHMLYQYDTNDPLFFGAKFLQYSKQGYMDGGPGYILSKESVRKFVEEGVPNEHLCKKTSDGAEDIFMGIDLTISTKKQ